ncbi:histone deacetylase [Shewanella sp. Isolate11]|uniref:histone deacetylase family protein n=1 Tax=Shewanella sp. Isolate11 TaxID=2908530 RepID=UPI001EFEE8DF|nr:histone deacetylase [Shewanella sp. Isolate11]MCG9696244.1 histone deacetylase [Shewanella sp. Isolate11]
MLPLIYHASYSQLALPLHHRFPQFKYQQLYQYLIDNQIANAEQFHQPSAVDRHWLNQIHSPDYVTQLLSLSLSSQAVRRMGLPLTPAVIERSLHSVSGTMQACDLAIQHGIALQLSGGYHHAHYDFGSGYCVFNDLIASAVHAKQSHDLSRVLIFDCDVHQGDGTATMSQQYPDVISCSIHCQQNFPARKQQSDIDIELPKGTQDSVYLDAIKQTLDLAIRFYQPELIIYDAGVDVHHDDDLGHFDISTQGIYQRDHLVLSTAKKLEIPIACVIGGGYSKQPQALSERHAQVFIAASTIW